MISSKSFFSSFLKKRDEGSVTGLCIPFQPLSSPTILKNKKNNNHRQRIKDMYNQKANKIQECIGIPNNLGIAKYPS